MTNQLRAAEPQETDQRPNSTAELLAQLRHAAADAEEARQTGDLVAQAHAQARVRRIADALLKPSHA